MPHWTDEETHQDLITPEAKVTLSKYNTKEDALVGGLNAMRDYGKPFKLPKSLENLPDDAVRADFTAKVGKLQGAIEDESAFEGMNFADGLADARNVSEELVGAFKKFAVENKLPKSLLPKLVLFNNQFANGIANAQTKTKTETAAKVNDTLKELFGGDDGVKTNTENVRRMFKDHAGLTAEEYEQTAPALIDSGITGSAVLSKALFNLAKPYTESTTETTEPGGVEKKGESNEDMSSTSEVLGW